MTSRVGFIAFFEAICAELEAAGFPAVSPWWAKEIRRFLLSGRKRWIVRSGRRAGKSTTMSRLAVAWALYGAWSVPPGDTAVIPFVSVDRSEAAGRIRTIGDILTALNITHERRADEIELTDPRVVFRVTTCSLTGVVGFTSIAIFGDEVARWESRDHAANPAKAVFGSLMPTLATQPEGFAVLTSSPWSTDDYHAECFDRGDVDGQITSYAPTWQANPTISESDTHTFESDEPTWRREYLGEPSAGLSLALDPEHWRAAIRPLPAGEHGRPILALDPAGGRSASSDSFAHALIRWVPEGDRCVLAVTDMGAFDGAFRQGHTSDSLLDELAAKAKRAGAQTVVADTHERGLLEHGFHARGLTFQPMPWSATSKPDAVSRFRRLLSDRDIILPDDERLKKELNSFQQKLMPSGHVTYAARSTGKDDRIAVILTGIMADISGAIERSPLSYPTLMDALKRATNADFSRLQSTMIGTGGRRGDFLPFFK